MRSSACKQSGFTLVEILVVMAIVGLIAASVVFTVPSMTRDETTPQTAAATLKAQLQWARERAMIEQRPLGLLLQAEGYQFLRWQQTEEGWRWQAVTEKGLAAQDYRDNLSLEWRIDEPPFIAQEKQLEDTLFSPSDDNEDEEQPIPQLLILPTGELSQFSIQFAAPFDAEPSAWLIADSAWTTRIADNDDTE
ncbi:general secretion pathway protein H [Idiomarina fontislapidosi]|uniref:Type II secretion system protein H n=1 Tax=Idiomarina fontislapidosi TaxID=263723 RepID=A0A432Y255_9GAMM|nr:type II secretion system minor pseudopilin GspH [Idiomarina fontislapidosi]PYE33177.1 general secretion pathway protein H [Idiomarina fontislapidosi]RUO55024.1 type II secretion system protein GspH [Idiomarina fontislapidosi]|tara:strand:- start:2343 stop:2921 length:579 start_codon:yes stop_codon:yes gene_type:complete